jgi:fatty-acyl-CoA synthase
MAPITSQADIEALEARGDAASPPARCPYGLIAAAARRFPDRDALRFLPSADLAQPAERTTYAALLRAIHRAANLFRSLGVGPDDAVAILAPNIPATHAVLWGAQLAGRACPINYLLQPDHIAALVRASGAKVLVTLGPSAELDIWSTAQRVLALAPLPLVVLRAPAGEVPSGIDFDQACATQPDHARVRARAVARPRRRAVPHRRHHRRAQAGAAHAGQRSAQRLVRAPFYGFDEDTVEVNGFPLFHVAGAFVYGLALLAIGATQVLPTLTGMRNAAFVRNYWKFCEREASPRWPACRPSWPACATCRSMPTSRASASLTPAARRCRRELAARFEQHRHPGAQHPGHDRVRRPGHHRAVRRAARARLGRPAAAVHRGARRALARRQGALEERCPPGGTGVVVLRGPHVSPGYTRPGAQRRHVRAGLAGLRRPRPHRRAGLCARHRPRQGRDHPRLAQHRSRPGGRRLPGPSGGGDVRRGRPSRTRMPARCRWRSSR